MFLRSAMLACATAMIVAPAVSAETPARCEATSFRVYFSHDSAALDSVASEMLQTAARNVADCDYAELRVRVDGRYAAQRGEAIRTAASAGDWNAVRVERANTQRVAYNNGPDYAEVTMTPERGNSGEPVRNDAGV
jgi:hypothetical protein